VNGSEQTSSEVGSRFAGARFFFSRGFRVDPKHFSASVLVFGDHKNICSAHGPASRRRYGDRRPIFKKWTANGVAHGLAVTLLVFALMCSTKLSPNFVVSNDSEHGCTFATETRNCTIHDRPLNQPVDNRTCSSDICVCTHASMCLVGIQIFLRSFDILLLIRNVFILKKKQLAKISITIWLTNLAYE
jgi:hypothetical protein